MAEHSPVGAADGTRRRDLILKLLMIAAFGPYLDRSFGLRTDHVLIYSVAPLAMACALPRFLRQRIAHPVTVIVALHAVCIAWTLAVTFLGGFEADSANVRLASIENAVQPVFVILLVAIVIGARPLPGIRSVLDQLLSLYIAIMCLNTLLASLSLFADLTPLMNHLTRSESATWFAARSGIRLTGVFSQPAAQGVAMTVAVLAWCYRQATGARGFWSNPAILVVLFFGGVLGLSKIFYFGAPVLLCVFLSPVRLLRIVCAPRSLLTVAALGLLVAFAMQEWRQGSLITQSWFNTEGPSGLVGGLTAGRFGSERDFFVQRSFSLTWHRSPVFGFGYGYSQLLDSGYLEYFLQGGAVSFGFHVLLIGTMVWWAIRGLPTAHPEAKLLLTMMALVIAGNIGAPVMSLNRFSTCFWIFAATLLCAIGRSTRPGAPSPPPAGTQPDRTGGPTRKDSGLPTANGCPRSAKPSPAPPRSP